MTSPRHEALIALCADAPRPIVDVGADHGIVARAVGGVPTERLPRRAAGPGPYVIADGLAPFRDVGTAVIAGMGARRISEILDGHRPKMLVLHAQDDPIVLRRWLAAHGWRIEREVLAPEAGGYAEIIRAVPGDEATTGAILDLGPRLSDDPLLEPCWRRRHRLDARIRGPGRADAEARMRRIEDVFRERGWAL